jgi:magnesium-transporting ATPase (P-type)
MNRAPRRSSDRVIDREMWGDIVYVGLIMAAITLIGMDMHLAGGIFTDRSVSNLDHAHQMVEARTMGFTILVFAQLFNALASRSAHRSAFHDFFTNHWLWAAIVVSIALQCVVIYVPFLNTAFGTVPLSFGAWIECILLSSVVLWATEIRKIWLRAGEKRRGGAVQAAL